MLKSNTHDRVADFTNLIPALHQLDSKRTPSHIEFRTPVDDCLPAFFLSALLSECAALRSVSQRCRTRGLLS